jgi:hypothetical protein
MRYAPDTIVMALTIGCTAKGVCLCWHSNVARCCGDAEVCASPLEGGELLQHIAQHAPCAGCCHCAAPAAWHYSSRRELTVSKSPCNHEEQSISCTVKAKVAQRTCLMREHPLQLLHEHLAHQMLQGS